MISIEYRQIVEEKLRALDFEEFLSLNYSKLAGDGSPRQFFRLFSKDSCESLVLVIPAKNESVELAESRSAWHIGSHLDKCKSPVPKPHFWDEESGMLLFEDLGDVRLQDCATSDRREELYTKVVTQLVEMQCTAIDGFDDSWCWDTPLYDEQLMLERESDYFLRAFWQGMLLQDVPAGLKEEFLQLASSSANASTQFFLHRDFQSRNVMVKDGNVRFIDFQGGRKGPLGYDLASLINDPYVDLPLDFREKLRETYWIELQKYVDLPRANFEQQYMLLGCQRNLQILGAFAFLSSVRKKEYFADYIRPSLENLRILLDSKYLSDLKVLKNTVEKASQLLE